MQKFTLAELAEKTGVTARTLRYWIAEKILEGPIGAGHGAYYTDQHLAAVERIKEAQAKGQSLIEIKTAEVVRTQPEEDEDALFEMSVERVTRIEPLDGAELILQDRVPAHHKRTLIKAVAKAARQIQTDGQKEEK